MFPAPSLQGKKNKGSARIHIDSNSRPRVFVVLVRAMGGNSFALQAHGLCAPHESADSSQRQPES